MSDMVGMRYLRRSYYVGAVVAGMLEFAHRWAGEFPFVIGQRGLVDYF